VEVKFKIDGNTVYKILSWEDMEILDSKNYFRARPILAKFVVDDKGDPVEYETAKKILGGLSFEEVADVVATFSKSFGNAMLNPTTGDESKEPSPKEEVPHSGGNSS
jgi:hypothetical protein